MAKIKEFSRRKPPENPWKCNFGQKNGFFRKKEAIRGGKTGGAVGVGGALKIPAI